ncbi:unnamed protein product [Lupinus luteus]|uniref:Uncharacterized protein n=1 Tax=Lupinus luteus TaxID=3873 RepID=A0AAV1XMX2_LUPLU
MSAGKSTEIFQFTQQTEVVPHSQSPDLNTRLEKIYHSMIASAISKIKVAESSETPRIENTSTQGSEDAPMMIDESEELDPNDVNPNPVDDNNVATQDPTLYKKRKRRTSTVLDVQTITFEHPSIVDNIDMDKLTSVHEDKDPMFAPVRRLSYRERLKGWVIEFTEREKTKIKEKFYHHPESTRTFRSYHEIAKFILYEESPGKYSSYRKEKRMKLKEDMGYDMAPETHTVESLCMPTSSVDHRSLPEIPRYVEKMHRDYNPCIFQNNFQLESQRRVLQVFENTWQEKKVADFQGVFFKTVASAKLPPGVKETDTAFIQAHALEVVPIRIYMPNEQDANVTTPNIAVHNTSKMTMSVMEEDNPVKNMFLNFFK